jgi:hypothetical protein
MSADARLRSRNPGTSVFLMRVGERFWGIVLALGIVTSGCEQKRSQGPLPLPVEVRSDTARSERLKVEPPVHARIWVAHVGSARVTPARGLALEPELPAGSPDTIVIPDTSPPMLEIDADLKPPILRSRALLSVPQGWPPKRRPESVELDVRVDEVGTVTVAQWTGGSRDSGLVRAAVDCASHMRFYPALRGGRPVAVWCRQRFDFGTQ